MVLEQQTRCNQDNPLHMEILNIKEHPWHMHDEDTMEVVYVLKGRITCGISIYPSIMEAGDIAVVNTETLHSYQGTDDNICLICHLHLPYFTSVISEIENTLIICNSASAVEYDKHYELLKKALAAVSLYYFNIHTPEQDALMDSCINFLSIMYNHFNFLRHEGVAIHTENVMKQRPVQAERVKRVMKYIYDNLAGKVSLEEIAAQEYVSKYYLSHLVSEFLNMPFRDYLSMTRAVYAQDYLYGTDLTLSEIADRCGFSNTEMFRKAYLKNAGRTPADDRRRIKGHTIHDIPLVDSDVLLSENIYAIVSLMGIRTSHAVSVNAIEENIYPVANVSIDFTDPSGFKLENTWNTFSIDSPVQLLANDTLDALAMLHEHRCFSNLSIRADLLLSIYTGLESWTFLGTLLRTLRQSAFTLIILNGDSREFSGLMDFSVGIGGPEIRFSAVGHTPACPAGSNAPGTLPDRDAPAAIAARHLSECPPHPSLYETDAGRPYLFDRFNMKTKAFYTYYFLNRLHPKCIYMDDTCCVTRANGKTAILLHNSLPGDSGIKKYMFNLRNIASRFIYQSLSMNAHYTGEAELLAGLGLDKAASDEIINRIRLKAYPAIEIMTADPLPEYNMFLSVPPDAVTLIEIDA